MTRREKLLEVARLTAEVREDTDGWGIAMVLHVCEDSLMDCATKMPTRECE